MRYKVFKYLLINKDGYKLFAIFNVLNFCYGEV